MQVYSQNWQQLIITQSIEKSQRSTVVLIMVNSTFDYTFESY